MAACRIGSNDSCARRFEQSRQPKCRGRRLSTALTVAPLVAGYVLRAWRGQLSSPSQLAFLLWDFYLRAGMIPSRPAFWTNPALLQSPVAFAVSHPTIQPARRSISVNPSVLELTPIGESFGRNFRNHVHLDNAGTLLSPQGLDLRG